MRARLIALTGLLAAALVVGSATAADAAPASGDACDLLIGPAKSACGIARSIATDATSAASVVSDPLGALAKACAQAAAWVVGKLAEIVTATTQVDFANPGFLKQYALVFGAATFLTLILWVLAVIKRAVRGVPPGQAIGEAMGLLWLSVVASAFTPLMLSLVVRLTDELTNALTVNTKGDMQQFLTSLTEGLNRTEHQTGAGPVLLIFVSLLALAAASVIWIELLLRGAMLYVGAVLGTAVYAGLVDKSLWRHVRRWAGLMVAIDLSKPVIVVILGLASAVTATGTPADAFSSALSGLAVLFLSIFASVLVYRFVPTLGDDMAQLHASRRTAANAGPAAAVNGPATYVRQGIATHGPRTGSSGGAAKAASSGGAAASGGLAAAAGMAAHGARSAASAGVHRAGVPTQR